MPTVLILSSHVAASRVGGAAQAAVLNRAGIETILIPTVVLGRQPGAGSPGGGPLSPDMFASVIEGVVASGALDRVNAVIAGYFAEPSQVRAAVSLIAAVRAASPEAWIVVDPIMGDDGKGLYVSEGVAEVLTAELIPLAELVTPNAWELARITGRPIKGPRAALAAARDVGGAILASSIAEGEDIGVLYADASQAYLAFHARLDADPKGAGDLLTAWFVSSILRGLSPREALFAAVEQAASMVCGQTISPRMISIS